MIPKLYDEAIKMCHFCGAKLELLHTHIPVMRYLKSEGLRIGACKVTLRIVEKQPVIYIRDFEFHNVPSALQFMRYIVNTELVKP